MEPGLETTAPWAKCLPREKGSGSKPYEGIETQMGVCSLECGHMPSAISNRQPKFTSLGMLPRPSDVFMSAPWKVVAMHFHMDKKEAGVC